MPTKAELQAQADDLTRQAEEAQAKAAAAKEEAAKPRTADDVFEQLLDAMLHHLGNPPRARDLYKELMGMKQQKEPDSATPAASVPNAADGHTS